MSSLPDRPVLPLPSNAGPDNSTSTSDVAAAPGWKPPPLPPPRPVARTGPPPLPSTIADAPKELPPLTEKTSQSSASHDVAGPDKANDASRPRTSARANASKIWVAAIGGLIALGAVGSYIGFQLHSKEIERQAAIRQQQEADAQLAAERKLREEEKAKAEAAAAEARARAVAAAQADEQRRADERAAAQAEAQAAAQAQAAADARVRPAEAPAQAGQTNSNGSQNAQLQAMYSGAVDAMRHGQYDRASGIADTLLVLAPGNATVLRLKQDIQNARQNAINRIQIQ